MTIREYVNTIMDSDKVAFLDAGRLTEFGEPADLLKDKAGSFTKLVEQSGKKNSKFLQGLSAAAKDTEPAHFSEPGTFVIRPDRTLYASSTQPTPFSRAAPKQLLRSLEYIVENDYPARGEATSPG